MVIIYYNCPRSSYIDLSLNSTNPSFSTYCKPRCYSLGLKQTRTRTTWKSETENKAKSHLLGSTLYSMFDSPDFFQCVRAKSIALCVYLLIYLQIILHLVSSAQLLPSWEKCSSHSLAVYSKPPDSSDSWITKWTLSDLPFFILLHNPWLCSKLHFKSYHPFDTTWLISPIREQHSLALNPKWFSSLKPPSLLSWNHLSGYQASFRSSEVWWAMGSLTTPTMDLDCPESTGHRS